MTTVQHRRGNTTQWAAPSKGAPKDGELVINDETDEVKIGDGSTSFADLPGLGDLIGAVGSRTSKTHAPALGLYFPEAEGAVADGSSSDTSAFEAAVAAMPAEGGVLSLTPDAVYKVSTTMDFAKPVRIVGNGATIKLGALVKLSEIADTSGVRIEGVTFDGDRATLGSGSNPQLRLLNVTDAAIRGCNFLHGIAQGIYLTNCQNIHIDDNYFSDFYGSPIYLGDPGGGNFNEDIWITNNRIDTCQVSNISGNGGIQAYGTSTVSNRYVHVLYNKIINSTKVGIGLDSIDHSQIIGNTIISTGVSAGECIAFTGSNNVIADNYGYGHGTGSAAGILLWAVAARTNDNNQIINNQMTNCGQGVGFTWADNGAAINDLLISGNHCYGNNRGVQSWITAGVTSGSQTNVAICNNNLLGNSTEARNVVQNSGGITGAPTVYKNLGDSREDVFTGSATIKGRFDASGLTADRVWTLPDATSTLVDTSSAQTLASKTLATPKITTQINDTNGNAILSLSPTASAVNRMAIVNAAAGGSPRLTVAGSDTNININMRPQGTGKVLIQDGTDTSKVATTDVTGLTGNRTFTFPDVAGTLGVKVAVPSTASSTGVVGSWAADSSFLYICTAANTWRRVAIATW